MGADAVLAQLAANQHGVVSVAQARAAGVTLEQLRPRVASGLLVPVRGVYRHAATADSPRTDLMAAVLARRQGAVASHRSAGRLRRLRAVPRWRPELTVPGTRRPRVEGIVVHRTDTRDPPDIAATDGIPVTSVARTLLDRGAFLPRALLATTSEGAAIRGLVTPLDLVATRERLGRPGRRGAAVLRAVVAGLVPPADLDRRLEHDSHNAVTAAGWRLFRSGWADVHQRRDATRAAIAAAVRQTGAACAPVRP